MAAADRQHHRLHLLVAGRVQGVFFRASTARRARELGLVGWVRNLPDGRVEVVAEGSRSGCRELLDFCGAGPPGARVDRVEASSSPAEGGFEAFEIRY